MPNSLQLSELEEDLLTELFNLGVGNAAASLSEMVKQEIKLSVPYIEFLSLAQLANKLGGENSICSVSQIVSGPFTAQSMLLFPEENSIEIVRQLLGNNLPDDTLLELQKESFSEIGNIVLNACIGSFSTALKEEFAVDLPVFELAKPGELLKLSDQEQDTALFIRIDLTLSSSQITGYLAFLMGSISLEKLKEALEKMLANL